MPTIRTRGTTAPTRPRPFAVQLIVTAALTLTGFVTTAAAAVVSPGSDRLFESPYYEQIRGKRLAVLAHHASRDSRGRHVIDLLHGAKEFKLVKIFAPEHGFRSADDTHLPDTQDPVTGLPVYSLYGPRKAPTPELLADIDLILIDLQDVGLRYYTYPATMALTMESARAAGKAVMVLDRPNPMDGVTVEGPVLEARFVPERNIAAFSPIPTRHGMTLGELARFFNSSAGFGIGADLTVVAMSGWRREMLWDDTGLRWEAPSPALPEFEQTILYTLFGTFESMAFAVGRGQTNERAFRQYGAPWISAEDRDRLVAALRALRLPGLQFDPIEWTPTRREFLGRLCRGFEVRVTDRAALESYRSLIEVLRTVRATFGTRFTMTTADRMLGASWVRRAVESVEPTETILARIERESRAFRTERAKHLLY